MSWIPGLSLKANLVAQSDNVYVNERVLQTAGALFSIDNGSITTGGGTFVIGACSANLNYFGTGADGALTVAANASANVPVADSSVVISNFSSLTINNAVNYTLATRAKLWVIYVQNNCVINGTLSMTARGASAASTSDVIINRYFSDSSIISSEANEIGSVLTQTDVHVGGAGGATQSSNAPGNVGSTITNGTGGGGSGAQSNGVGTSGGAGAAGTAFSGGTGGGGGGRSSTVGSPGSANGGTGGAGAVDATGASTGGGAGNPGGAGGGTSGTVGSPGTAGTGGTIILIVGGTLSGTGTISSNGSQGGNASGASVSCSGGGASGGGRVMIFAVTNTFSGTGTTQANGGLGGTATGGIVNQAGGAGGAGAITTNIISANVLLASNLQSVTATSTPIVGATSLLATSPFLIEVDNTAPSYSINLPAASVVKEFIFSIVGNSTNVVSLVASGTDKINGSTVYNLPANITVNGTVVSAQYAAIRIISDGNGKWLGVDSADGKAGENLRTFRAFEVSNPGPMLQRAP